MQTYHGPAHHIRPDKNPLYKTEHCSSYELTGTCRYGAKCQFAHGGHELRTVSRHPKYKTEICKTFHSTGHCPYGRRCRFIHDIQSRDGFSDMSGTEQSMAVLQSSFSTALSMVDSSAFSNNSPEDSTGSERSLLSSSFEHHSEQHQEGSMSPFFESAWLGPGFFDSNHGLGEPQFPVFETRAKTYFKGYTKSEPAFAPHNTANRFQYSLNSGFN